MNEKAGSGPFELPDDYGDPDAEYRAFEDACALVARVDRAVVRVHGERHGEMLNGIVSNEVKSLAGVGRAALLLNPKGRVLADLRVLPFGGSSWVDAPRAALENVLGAFRKYLPPTFAPFEDSSGDVALLGLYGPRAAAVASAALGRELPEEHLAVAEVDRAGAKLAVVRNRRLGRDGVEVFVSSEEAAGLREALAREIQNAGGRVAGRRAFEAARVEWGVPMYGADITDSNLAQETGLAESLSFDKGCYLGQEVVARIHFRGHVNRHLRGLRFEGALPRPGTRLFAADRDVGQVTSAVHSPELGPIGMGYVRREVEPSSTLTWRAEDGREGGATVSELPFRKAFEVVEGQP